VWRWGGVWLVGPTTELARFPKTLCSPHCVFRPLPLAKRVGISALTKALAENSPRERRECLWQKGISRLHLPRTVCSVPILPTTHHLGMYTTPNTQHKCEAIMKLFFPLLVVALVCVAPACPTSDGSTPVQQLVDAAMTNTRVYERLAYLGDMYGPRFSGTPALEAAIEWAKGLMEDEVCMCVCVHAYGSSPLVLV
jgi:hypothetical protein